VPIRLMPIPTRYGAGADGGRPWTFLTERTSLFRNLFPVSSGFFLTMLPERPIWKSHDGLTDSLVSTAAFSATLSASRTDPAS